MIKLLLTRDGWIHPFGEKGFVHNSTIFSSEYMQCLLEIPVLYSIAKLNYHEDPKMFELDNPKETEVVDLETFVDKSYYYLLEEPSSEYLTSTFIGNPNANYNTPIYLYHFPNGFKPIDDTTDTHSYDAFMDKLADANNKMVVYEYRFKDEEEQEFFYEIYKKGVSPVIIKTLLVGREYGYDNKKMYDHHNISTTKKVRDIYAPKEDVKEVSRELLRVLTAANNKTNDYRGKFQYAYKEDTSIVDGALVHRPCEWTVKLDISGFFDNCNWDLVEKYLKWLYDGGNKYVVHVDTVDFISTRLRWMFINPDTGGLYQGNPISGIISNHILRPAAYYLGNILEKKGQVLSIYADDIAVSSNDKLKIDDVKSDVEYVFNYYKLPFKINKAKTRLVKNNGRKIFGIRINHNKHITIPRVKYRLLRSMLHRLSRDEEITIKPSTLEGWLNFALFVDDRGRVDKEGNQMGSGKVRRLVLKYMDTLDKYGIYVPIEGQLEVDDFVYNNS